MDLYYLAVIPPEPLQSEVYSLKEEMKVRFDAIQALKSPAHITLQMPFKRSQEEEGRLSIELKKFAKIQKPFDIQLAGFEVFAPSVIFIDVVNHTPINTMQRDLQYCLRDQLNFPAKELATRFHPHMTIAARDLSEEAFRKAWPEFEKREFTASFEVKSLFLLKHNGKTWDTYQEFPFQEV